MTWKVPESVKIDWKIYTGLSVSKDFDRYYWLHGIDESGKSWSLSALGTRQGEARNRLSYRISVWNRS